MLDIKYIVENTEKAKKSLAKKGFDGANIDKLLNTYQNLNKLKTSLQAKAEEKNKLSNAIKSAPAEEKPSMPDDDMAMPDGFEMPDLSDLDAMMKEAGL